MCGGSTMSMMRTSNPALNANVFQIHDSTSTSVMTLQGTVAKTAILLAIVVAGASFTWYQTMQGFAAAGVAAGAAGPGEERQDGSRRAGIVAEVEVVCSGIIEVYGAFDEAEAEDFGIEVEVALGVGGDRRDVMQTNDWFGHETFFRSNRCCND